MPKPLTPQLLESVTTHLRHELSVDFEPGPFMSDHLGTMITTGREFQVEIRAMAAPLGRHTWTIPVQCPVCGMEFAIEATQRTAWIIRPGEFDGEDAKDVRGAVLARIRKRTRGGRILGHAAVFVFGAMAALGLGVVITDGKAAGMAAALAVFLALFALGEAAFLRGADRRALAEPVILLADGPDDFVCARPNAANIITDLWLKVHDTTHKWRWAFKSYSHSLELSDLLREHGLEYIRHY